MRRIALCICYDGSRYHGWQYQEEVTSVQQIVEHAVSRVADQPVTTVCAGRTDAGVHATAQVVHFDTEAERTDHSWVFGANSNLPADISVSFAKLMTPDFHARFSALSRTYLYILCNQSVRPGIFQKAGRKLQNLNHQRNSRCQSRVFYARKIHRFVQGAAC